MELGIIVKESRGRLSYLTPVRTKPITARKLGDDFDKAAVLAALDQNVLRTVLKPAFQQKSAAAPTQKITTMEQRMQNATQLSRMVDIEAKKAEARVKDTNIGQKSTISKTPAEPISSSRRWAFLLPKNWLPLMKLPILT